MLLICTGPDTYRALSKAQELEQAFIGKFDKQADSVEHLESGKGSIDDIIKKVDTVSLFSPKRFIRCDDLIASCPKNKQAILIQALNKDADNVIVVTVESEPVDEASLKPWKAISKFFLYSYPQLDGQAFQNFIQDEAKKRNLTFTEDMVDLVNQANGDTWFVMKELEKREANPDYQFTKANKIDQQIPLPWLISQIRNQIRFNRQESQTKQLKKAIESLFVQRNSFCDEEEGSALL